MSLYILSILLGCSQKPALRANKLEQAFASTPVAEYLLHTVTHQGETLSLIAKHYTGTSTHWRQLLSATPWLRDETILLGQLVLVLKSLVVNEIPTTKLKPAYGKTPKNKTPRYLNLPLADAPKPPGVDPEKLFLRQRLYEELVAEINR